MAHLVKHSFADDIGKIFRALLKVGYMFDNITYVAPLRTMVEFHKTPFDILMHMISCEVVIDTGLLLKFIELSFKER